MTKLHHYSDMIELFDRCFFEEYHTRLVKGEDEPVYLPADDTCQYHRIFFAHGFYASALHEISHWCIAGAERRQQVDFGYWYCPDGRDEATQQRFETAEIKPQALEWMFSVAAGFPFNISCDNLEGEYQPDRVAFQRQVHAQVMTYLQQGLPQRPARLIAALHHFYHTPTLNADHFPWPQELE